MDFKLELATNEMCRYACLNWHYSKSVPSGKLFKFAVYEYNKFIGVIIYGLGSGTTQYKSYLKYGIKENEFCELVRIAMNKHEKPVSKYLGLSLKLLKKYNPGLKLVSSFADPNEGHHGGIYQATNWIYVGKSSENRKFYYKGKWVHKYSMRHYKNILNQLMTKKVPGKNRYLYPLDNRTYKDIIHLKQPYPKRVEHEINASNFQLGESRAVLTNTLQLNNNNSNILTEFDRKNQV